MFAVFMGAKSFVQNKYKVFKLKRINCKALLISLPIILNLILGFFNELITEN